MSLPSSDLRVPRDPDLDGCIRQVSGTLRCIRATSSDRNERSAAATANVLDAWLRGMIEHHVRQHLEGEPSLETLLSRSRAYRAEVEQEQDG
ncbi:MAG: hypothetical protein KDK12_03030 [Rhodobacteraceae bacterium]|nr:hypothetical protein [Paracoccaceae bacterium]